MQNYQDTFRTLLKELGWELYLKVREDEERPCDCDGYASFSWPMDDLPATIMCNAENAMRLPGLPHDIRVELFDRHQQKWMALWLSFVEKWNSLRREHLQCIMQGQGIGDLMEKNDIRVIPGIAPGNEGWLKAREMYELAIRDIPEIPKVFRAHICFENPQPGPGDCCIRVSASETVGGNHSVKMSINTNSLEMFPEKDDRVFHTFRLSADTVAEASGHIQHIKNLALEKIRAMELVASDR